MEYLSLPALCYFDSLSEIIYYVCDDENFTCAPDFDNSEAVKFSFREIVENIKQLPKEKSRRFLSDGVEDVRTDICEHIKFLNDDVEGNDIETLEPPSVRFAIMYMDPQDTRQ